MFKRTWIHNEYQVMLKYYRRESPSKKMHAYAARLEATICLSRQAAQTDAVNSMNLAADYLAVNFDRLTDPFEVCTVTYALHLAQHSMKTEAFLKIQAMGIIGEHYDL